MWSEKSIGRAIALQLLDRKCVVLVDNCSWTGHECDVLGVTTDLRIIDVEVKISRADLKADAKKSKWWHFMTFEEKRTAGIDPGTPEWWNAKMAVVHPRKVWKHYYALPADIWKPELADSLPSKASGILLLRQGRNPGEASVIVQCERRATPNREALRLTAEQATDIARLANLRMWESYKQLEELNNRSKADAAATN